MLRALYQSLQLTQQSRDKPTKYPSFPHVAIVLQLLHLHSGPTDLHSHPSRHVAGVAKESGPNDCGCLWVILFFFFFSLQSTFLLALLYPWLCKQPLQEK